jgi:hypothetical protein
LKYIKENKMSKQQKSREELYEELSSIDLKVKPKEEWKFPGADQISSTGSLRKNAGKPEFSQLDPRFVEGLMRLMTKGEQKYGKFNWAVGANYSTILDSLMRHYLAICKGEEIDKESGEKHSLHIAANAMFLFTTMNLNNIDLDDRYFKEEE